MNSSPKDAHTHRGFAFRLWAALFWAREAKAAQQPCRGAGPRRPEGPSQDTQADSSPALLPIRQPAPGVPGSLWLGTAARSCSLEIPAARARNHLTPRRQLKRPS